MYCYCHAMALPLSGAARTQQIVQLPFPSFRIDSSTSRINCSLVCATSACCSWISCFCTRITSSSSRRRAFSLLISSRVFWMSFGLSFPKEDSPLLIVCTNSPEISDTLVFSALRCLSISSAGLPPAVLDLLPAGGAIPIPNPPDLDTGVAVAIGAELSPPCFTGTAIAIVGEEPGMGTPWEQASVKARGPTTWICSNALENFSDTTLANSLPMTSGLFL
mmetsp:Transcript_66743/g.118079  ORF Transcript_66743/g.118079 Transcript_66743/m.118079 type:complete len:220 (+) Transcript_66743:34-693(+)